MANAEHGTGSRNGSTVHEPEHVSHGDADLTALLARLGDDVVNLVDGKLGLIKLDVEEQVRAYARTLYARAAAAVVIAVGVTLVAAGIAFGVTSLVPPSIDPLVARALAFGAVGVVGVAAGVMALSWSSEGRRG